jgi:DNA recombination protein RmuC
MSVVVLVVSIVVLIIAVVLFLQKPKGGNSISGEELKRLREENSGLQIAFAKAEERAAGLILERDKADKLLQEERVRHDQAVATLNSELLAEKNRMAKAEEAFKAQRERLSDQEKSIQEIQKKFQLEFQNIAGKLLEEKSQKFVETNKTNLDILLNPLKENIKAFEEKVDKVYNMEAAERNTLKGVISQLMELNKLISNEAQNLTKALKGDSKKQGNWGEVILERVLERSGLVKDREYRMQVSLTSENGGRLQPDVIVDLPDEKHIIIDSKVSLVAYERLVSCETEEERKLYSKAHVESIRGHVNDLSSKNYHALYQINSPDKPLKPGDSFTQRAPMNIPVGKDSTSAKIDASVTYKLIKIADGKAYFDMIPNFSLNVLAGKASVNMSGTGTGTMVYSIKDDFPLSKEGNINLNIKVVTPKVNIDGTIV